MANFMIFTTFSLIVFEMIVISFEEKQPEKTTYVMVERDYSAEEEGILDRKTWLQCQREAFNFIL